VIKNPVIIDSKLDDTKNDKGSKDEKVDAKKNE
jgi:hypothetical protein